MSLTPVSPPMEEIDEHAVNPPQQPQSQPSTQDEGKVEELANVLNNIITRLTLNETHIKTLFEYVTTQINGTVFDIYVHKCKDQLTEKKAKCEALLKEKKEELERVSAEENELKATLEELDDALKMSDFPHQVAAIVNDRKNSIITRIELLGIDKLTELVGSLTAEIEKLTQKIDTLSNFIVDE